MKNHFIILALIVFGYNIVEGQIIDVHLHSYTESDYYGGNRIQSGVESPKTVKEHLNQTIQLMDKHNIEFAIISGSLESVELYTKADSRFIPGYEDEKELIPITQFEELVKSGKIKVFGEILAVYHGRTLNDPIYQPYLEICEKYEVPVACHTGGAKPMTPYTGYPDFRISFGDPLLIEDVLVRYPKLKLYLMHGGGVFFEHSVRMLAMYRQLYIDLGVILWINPMTQDYAIRLLKLAKNTAVLDRVMFGTDQMVWPGAITSSIDFLNRLDFLTNAEKEMILYDNAKRFLGIN